MLNIKKLLTKLLDNQMLYMQEVSFPSSSVPADSYEDKTVLFTMPVALQGKNVKPVIGTWNISGSLTSFVYTMGQYIADNGDNTWTAHLKVRNRHSSSTASVSAVFNIFWVYYQQ